MGGSNLLTVGSKRLAVAATLLTGCEAGDKRDRAERAFKGAGRYPTAALGDVGRLGPLRGTDGRRRARTLSLSHPARARQ